MCHTYIGNIDLGDWMTLKEAIKMTSHISFNYWNLTLKQHI